MGNKICVYLQIISFTIETYISPPNFFNQKTKILSQMKLRILIALLVIPFFIFSQQKVAQELISLEQSGAHFEKVNPFTFEENNLNKQNETLEGLKKATLLKPNVQTLQSLKRTGPALLELTIPRGEKTALILELVEHDIFTPDFVLRTSDGREVIGYDRGRHYKGIIKGDKNSLVAISIYNNEMMGLISSDAGNQVLGRLQKSRENEHVLYFDNDLPTKNDFECGVIDDGVSYSKEDLAPSTQGRDVGDCVKLYIEIDNDIVNQKGGATNATNYITGLFGQLIILYDNENIDVAINEILAWTTTSPYSSNSSSGMLDDFLANTGDFNGDLAHLVSYQASGGIAYVNTLCSGNPDYKKAFSSIDASYNNVPTFSWSVMVITHEMGHNMGSQHTHACVWNGNSTAIDGCAGSTEGNCANPGNPAGGGTIMSYCHLTNVGIDLNQGFGPQPGNLIRNNVNQSGNCLTSCDGPPPDPTYCFSSSNTTQDEFIQSVSLENINNNSGSDGGYGDFTAQSTQLAPNTSYTITCTPGYTGTIYNEVFNVWIDYNGDFDWFDSGELVGTGSGTSAVSITFTTPANISGTTRMRVSMQYNAAPPICGSFQYGEVEDYTVVLGAVLPTCNDGIQNQGEEGVDCGGPCAPCDTGAELIFGSYFESGWDGWTDGGADCGLVNNANKAYEGNRSVRLTDHSIIQSSMTYYDADVSAHAALELKFYFRPESMESGENFIVRIHQNSTWPVIANYRRGTDFENNNFYETTIIIGSEQFDPNFPLDIRIQSHASADNDRVFIDEVTLTGLGSNSNQQSSVSTINLSQLSTEMPGIAEQAKKFENRDAEEVLVYPNPATDILNIDFSGEVQSIQIVSMQGQIMATFQDSEDKRSIDISNLPHGMYFVMFEKDGEIIPKKVMKH